MLAVAARRQSGAALAAKCMATRHLSSAYQGVQLDFFANDDASDATPIVFLHGLLGSAANWKSLSKNHNVYPGRKTICMSLRNHGASPNTDTPMSIENLAADVAATLPVATGSDAPVHIVGHSLGGKVAMALALSQPALVKRMVVADISPVAYDKRDAQWQEVVSICAAVDDMDVSQLKRRSDGNALLTERRIPKDRQAFVLQNLAPTSEGGFEWRVNPPVIRASLPNLADFPHFPAPFDAVPTLFVAGERSTYIRQEHKPEIERLFPGSKHTVIPNAGHWVHAEAPAAFMEAVARHLLERE